MILRLHHHRGHLAEAGAQGRGGRAFSWEPDPSWEHQGPRHWLLHSCETQHLVSQPTTETTIASVSQLVKT